MGVLLDLGGGVVRPATEGETEMVMMVTNRFCLSLRQSGLLREVPDLWLRLRYQK